MNEKKRIKYVLLLVGMYCVCLSASAQSSYSLFSDAQSEASFFEPLRGGSFDDLDESGSDLSNDGFSDNSGVPGSGGENGAGAPIGDAIGILLFAAGIYLVQCTNRRRANKQ